MKVKVTATVSVEVELHHEDYDAADIPVKTDENIIAWELQQAKEKPHDSYLMEWLMSADAEISDVKVVKLEETAAAAA